MQACYPPAYILQKVLKVVVLEVREKAFWVAYCKKPLTDLQYHR